MAQIDIFATAAEDDAIPDTTWLPHYGPWMGWEWDESDGPHPNWEDLRACVADEEDVEVYRDKKGFRARVHIVRDTSTNLWLGGFHVDSPTGGGGGPATYSPAAYRAREACIAAWKVRAMARLEEYRKRHEEDLAWRKRFDAADHAERIRRKLEEDDDPETGEEGMEDRFEDLDDEDQQ